MPRILLSYPSIDTNAESCFECGCPTTYSTMQLVALEPVVKPYNISSIGKCDINDSTYSYKLNVDIKGDQIGGTISLTSEKRKTVITTLLSQTTCYPLIPYTHDWSNITASGFGSYLTLTVKDNVDIAKSQDLPTKLTNNLSVTFSLSAINVNNNTLVGNSAASTSPYLCTPAKCLPYSGNTWLWQAPGTAIDTKVISISDLPGSSTDQFKRSAIYVKLNQLIVEENIGYLIISGRMTSYTLLPSTDTWIATPFEFRSNTIAINNIFATSNSWSRKCLIVDTLNPSISLITRSSQVFPYYASNLQLVFEIILNGKYSPSMSLRT